MSSREARSRTRRFLADAPFVVGFALPYIVGGGLLGAALGRALGATANGFRVGVIIGGAVAFALLMRRKRHSS